MLNPVLFNMGPFEIRYYGLLMALAFLIGYFILRKLSNEFEISEKQAEDFFIYALLSLIVGARLFEVLFYDPSYYFSNPIKILYVWEGGLASHGAIILTFIVAILYSKLKNIKFYNLADLFIIPIALGASFVRIGNFINNELVGRVTNVPWAVKFSGYEGLRHPVQLYQASYLFVIFLILFKIRKLKDRKPGIILWSFLLLDSMFRFITEFFKDLPKDYGFYLYNLNLAQYFSVAIVIISLIMLIRMFKIKDE